MDLDELEAHSSLFAGADAVFCTLGTTRGAAGSAAAMRRVDVEYVDKAAAAARAAGVPHFLLLTSQGANANVWYSELKPFHMLFYMRLKGEAEQAASSRAFPHTSIFRPGMLDRGDKARWSETIARALLPATHVRTVARAMIAVAEQQAAAPPAPPTIYETPDIKRVAQSAA